MKPGREAPQASAWVGFDWPRPRAQVRPGAGPPASSTHASTPEWGFGLMRALGLTSGTSADGVDVGLIETDGEQVRSFAGFPDFCPNTLCRRCAAQICPAFGAEQPSDATAAAERADRGHVEAVKKRWSRESGTAPATLDVVGFPRPDDHPSPQQHTSLGRSATARRWARAIGDEGGEADLRITDGKAQAGEGAAGADLSRRAGARRLRRPLAVVNIGGVGNVTWIGADGLAAHLRHRAGNGPRIDD